MKKISILITCIFSLVAIAIWAPDCWAPTPTCGDNMVNQEWEECDGTATDGYCPPAECVDCLCPEPPSCGDNMVNQEWEECDGTATDGYCPPAECVDCLCPEGNCDPRTQGFWRRICKGEHPETPGNFDGTNCTYLLIKGSDRSDPCVRAESQYEALMFNITYDGYLSATCLADDLDGNEMTVVAIATQVRNLIDSGECKDAADLAESVNNP